MNFLAPLALLWLPLIGGAIVVLYMLRMKRRDVTVSSVMLWQAALKDTQANAPFQKLRRNLLLILQLLIAALLVFAVSRPFHWAAGLGGKTVAVVLDASASMRATDVPGGRFAEAVEQARFIIRQKASGDGVALVLAGDKPVLLAPLTTDQEKLLHALDTARATDAPNDMREAIQYAASLIASRAGAQVTVVTDGAFGRLDEMALGGPKLAFVVVGKRSENVGITAFDVRETLGGAARQAFVTAQNFGKAERTVPLEIRVNGQLTNAHAVTLKAGEAKSETFENLKADQGGVAQARLDIEDDLAADNQASVTLAPRRTVRILLVTAGNPFLEKVLNTDDRVGLVSVPPADYRADDSKARDLTVFDATAPPKDLPAGRYLFWGGEAAGASERVPVVPTNAPDADRPQVLDWSRTHPLMRFVDLANVNVLRARAVAPAPWATTLAESSAGPLIVAGEKNDLRAVYVDFGMLESDIPLRVAFPIFLTNCIGWLTARPGDSGGVTHPGEVMPLAATPDAGTLTIHRPDGSTDTLPVPPNGPPLYDHTTAVGIYRATGKGFEQTFAVSLLSTVESNIAPVEKPSVLVTDTAEDAKPAPGATPGTDPAVTTRRELWPWLAGIALLVLFAEWLVYHRRL